MGEGKLAEEEEEGKGGLSSLAEEIPGPNHKEFGFFFSRRERLNMSVTSEDLFLETRYQGTCWGYGGNSDRKWRGLTQVRGACLQTPFLFPIYFHCQGINEEPGEGFLPKEISLANC